MVIRLVTEPTAASLACGLDRLGQELHIVVIDLGGGTLDVTIMKFGKGVFEVKAASGDTQLGGTDMNQRVFEYLVERFQMATGVDERKDPKAAACLIEAAEAAKVDLGAPPARMSACRISRGRPARWWIPSTGRTNRARSDALQARQVHMWQAEPWRPSPAAARFGRRTPKRLWCANQDKAASSFHKK